MESLSVAYFTKQVNPSLAKLPLNFNGGLAKPWWRHEMETFSTLQAFCVPGEFPAKGLRSFDVFFDPRLNKRLSKQSWDWWFETLPCPLWHHSNAWVNFLRKID